MRVVEISDQLGAAAYCGKLFRRWGHEVVRVESPGLDEPERAAHLYLNGGKPRLRCDVASASDREALDRMLATADILITDRSVGDIERHGLLEGDGGPPVRIVLTPFGLTGPYASAPATEASLLALGGYTNLIGDPDKAPLTFVGRYASYQQGTFGFIAGLATTRARPSETVTIDLSAMEALASLHQSTYSKWLETGTPRGRSGNRMDGAANSLLRVRDGWAGVSFQQQFWFSFATMIGRLDIAEAHPLSTPAGRLKHYDELVEVVEGAFRDRTMQEVFDEAQGQWRIPIGKLLGVSEALDDPHLLDRDFWRPLEQPPVELAHLRVPGSPFRVVGDPLPPEPAPQAPRPVTAVEGEPWRTSGRRDGRATHGDVTRPLEGVRVLDLSRVWAGPVTGRILGDLGADVIKIEAPTNRGPRQVAQGTRGYLITDQTRSMPWNAQTVFNQLQRNRRSLCLDLKSEEGKALFLDLVRTSDVVIENFSARAMRRLGLGYEVLSAANPRLIYVPMPAFGRTGPYRDYVGLGTSVEPLAAIPSVLGYEGGDAQTAAIAIPDPMAGTTAAAAVLVGLQRRDETGLGCEFDFSQQESSIGFIGEYFIAAQLDGTPPTRAGNSHPRYAPYGIYPCEGEDEWIAVAARDDREWNALDRIAGRDWSSDPRFASAEGRRVNRDDLDSAIAAWTVERTKLELCRSLMAAGVPAGAVLKGPELIADAHLEARAYFADLEHPETGPQRFDGAPFVFNGTRGHRWWRPTPMLGEHNREILATVLGLDETEIARLEAEGVVQTAPPE